VRVLLAHAHKDDGLASGVYHVEGSTYLLVNCVELSHDDAVDTLGVGCAFGRIQQSLVELCELVNSIVSDKSFTDEENNVRKVSVDQLGHGSHESFIALHAASSINQQDIVLLSLALS